MNDSSRLALVIARSIVRVRRQNLVAKLFKLFGIRPFLTIHAPRRVIIYSAEKWAELGFEPLPKPYKIGYFSNPIIKFYTAFTREPFKQRIIEGRTVKGLDLSPGNERNLKCIKKLHRVAVQYWRKNVLSGEIPPAWVEYS